MFVSRSMTRRVVTIDPEAGIFEAQGKMLKHRIRHLPVVDENSKLIGIVTDRDIRSALPSVVLHDYDTQREQKRISEMKIRDVMTPNPITISPQYTIQDALLLIQKTRVGAFPVVDENGFLKGILSVRDLLRAFIAVLGIGEPGTLLGILVEDRIGQMKRIVDTITGENISIGSILVARHWQEGKRAVFPYLLTNTVTNVKKRLQELGFTLLDPMEWYMDQLPKHEP